MDNNQEGENENRDEMDLSEDDTESEDTQSSDSGERRPFDIAVAATHQYLQLNGSHETPHGLKFEEPGKVITVSILEMPIILLPTQLLPFHTDYPLLVSQLRQAARENEYIALKPKVETLETDIATLIQVFSSHYLKFCIPKNYKLGIEFLHMNLLSVEGAVFENITDNNRSFNRRF
ncbi:unnamed protein product [Gongylonema pulchrum]|uniref:RWD domain-containing protein n=1 Tax=Gongylonema pulchrum TaxID=637853 RepID=A0A183EPB2_9BILA|nr:unnamed protein product [Gongylonema pulchrum]